MKLVEPDENKGIIRSIMCTDCGQKGIRVEDYCDFLLTCFCENKEVHITLKSIISAFYRLEEIIEENSIVFNEITGDKNEG
jgi:hypothetical protein